MSGAPSATFAIDKQRRSRYSSSVSRSAGGELIQGTLDLLILKTLQKKSMHGYSIAVEIEHRSSDVLRVEEGSLYPALHRLELAELLSSEWKLSDTNRRAKFYSLTAAGRKRLAADTTAWKRMVAATAQVLEIA
jgi:PadR family transcriptional regulator PadR